MTIMRFKQFDQFSHPVFSTHSVPDQDKAQRKLTRLAKKLECISFNPVWVSPEHGTCLVTCRNKDQKKLIEGALYEITFEARVVDTHANIWIKKLKLISKPEKGRLINYDSESDSEDS
jgi:hypothetical protein